LILLASIVLSMQRPFEMGDFLEVVGVIGYIQQMNMRSTILMTLDKRGPVDCTESTCRSPCSLNDPEPRVLADSLEQATINLRVYFWLNCREHSWLKVRSSVIRPVKLAFQEHGISMPDGAREIVFPTASPSPCSRANRCRNARSTKQLPADSPQGEPAAVSAKAEAGFSSEAVVIEEQARQRNR